ncbi:hypothetical protein HW555_005516 [Spodoptera exigua]|uniref:MADF domain-containing protein n=1 Tax=Spodoptera exigua TaxID=7107 RepID=A0A835GJK1_SPOEX|nr:hypothetical protein HW555_005516 [Spodoptera exigua]
MNHIDTGRVIDEVRIRRCLWDPADDFYKNKDAKNKAWEEIGKELCGEKSPTFPLELWGCDVCWIFVKKTLTCTVIRRNCWLIGENIYKIYNYSLVNQRKMLRVRLSVTL